MRAEAISSHSLSYKLTLPVSALATLSITFAIFSRSIFSRKRAHWGQVDSTGGSGRSTFYKTFVGIPCPLHSIQRDCHN